MSPDIEELAKLAKPFWLKDITEKNVEMCYEFIDQYYKTGKDLTDIKEDFRKFQRDRVQGDYLKFGILIYYYKLGRVKGRYPAADCDLEESLKVMNVRENSGVMVFSIFTSGYPSYTKTNPDGTTEVIYEFGTKENPSGAFGCKYDCHFCPKFDGMPRSYILEEPSVARAAQCDFNVIRSIFYRAVEYIRQGHPVDKAEVIIQGGTYDSYSKEYRREFMRDMYYAFNVMMDYLFNINIESNNPADYFEHDGHKLRPKRSLQEEIKLNEHGQCRVIGVTPETRPDQINYDTIKFLREVGATRVQIGVQHSDDNILRHINRGCYHRHTIRAIQMLKDNGLKCDIHLLLDTAYPPEYEGKMPEIDRDMLQLFNTDPALKVDQMKIYPCVVTPHTKIKEWFEQGIYKPYGGNRPIDKMVYKRMSKEEKFAWRMTNPLYKNIYDFYSQIHPSVRVNRIFRDIPVTMICGGTTNAGMRSEIDRDMEDFDSGSAIGCIRRREAGNHHNIKRAPQGKPILKVLEFDSSSGTEYFISWETDEAKPILYSFLRLRLSHNSGKTHTGKVIFPELVDCALVRELHTYGKIQPCKENLKYYQDKGLLFGNSKAVQHKGFGRKLLEKAEEIARSKGYTKMAVIAGVGVRQYYRAQGFTTDSAEGCYQIKELGPVIKDIQNNQITKINIYDQIVNFVNNYEQFLLILGLLPMLYFIYLSIS